MTISLRSGEQFALKDKLNVPDILIHETPVSARAITLSDIDSEDQYMKSKCK
jgi:hypothetical protein